eukprot:3033417-Pyramimonas_sp.AAC.1
MPTSARTASGHLRPHFRSQRKRKREGAVTTKRSAGAFVTKSAPDRRLRDQKCTRRVWSTTADDWRLAGVVTSRTVALLFR